MYQKICNALSIVASVASISVIGAGTFGYFWITNESNQNKIKQQIVEQVTGSLPIPKLSGPAIPTGAAPKGLDLPKF